VHPLGDLPDRGDLTDLVQLLGHVSAFRANPWVNEKYASRGATTT